MTPTQISEETVGRYFVDEHGELWRHVSYAAFPTAAMERVDGAHAGVRRGGCVGSPNLDGFTLLVPESCVESFVNATALEDRCDVHLGQERCTLIAHHLGQHLGTRGARWAIKIGRERV